MLKVSAFYLEKQKSFIPKKFLAVVNIKTKKLCLLTQFSRRFWQRLPKCLRFGNQLIRYEMTIIVTTSQINQHAQYFVQLLALKIIDVSILLNLNDNLYQYTNIFAVLISGFTCATCAPFKICLLSIYSICFRVVSKKGAGGAIAPPLFGRIKAAAAAALLLVVLLAPQL